MEVAGPTMRLPFLNGAQNKKQTKKENNNNGSLSSASHKEEYKEFKQRVFCYSRARVERRHGCFMVLAVSGYIYCSRGLVTTWRAVQGIALQILTINLGTASSPFSDWSNWSWKEGTWYLPMVTEFAKWQSRDLTPGHLALKQSCLSLSSSATAWKLCPQYVCSKKRRFRNVLSHQCQLLERCQGQGRLPNQKEQQAKTMYHSGLSLSFIVGGTRLAGLLSIDIYNVKGKWFRIRRPGSSPGITSN